MKIQSKKETYTKKKEKGSTANTFNRRLEKLLRNFLRWISFQKLNVQEDHHAESDSVPARPELLTLGYDGTLFQAKK